MACVMFPTFLAAFSETSSGARGNFFLSPSTLLLTCTYEYKYLKTICQMRASYGLKCHYTNDPVLTSPARLYLAIMTPVGVTMDLMRVKAAGIVPF
jgi:hypothetical protein